MNETSNVGKFLVLVLALFGVWVTLIYLVNT